MLSIEEIESLLKKYKESLSDSSVATYASNIHQTIVMSTKFEKSPAGLVEFIEAKYVKPATKKIKIMSMLTYYRASGFPEEKLARLASKFRELFGKVEENAEMNLSSEADRGNIPNVNDINKTLKYLEGLGDLQGLIIVHIHKLFPIRNELADTKIRNFKTGVDNYITHDNRTLELFKRKNGGIFKGNLQDPIPELLSRWKEQNRTDWLLLNSDGQKLSGSGLTKYLNRIFLEATGKKVGTSRIRKGFVSGELSGQKRYAELKENAKMMGHSVDTHLKHYRKLDVE